MAAVVASLYQNILPVEAQNDLLLSLGFVATFPAENLALTLTFFHFDLAVVMILSLLLMIGAFVIGFVAAGMNMRKAVGSGANETE